MMLLFVLYAPQQYPQVLPTKSHWLALAMQGLAAQVSSGQHHQDAWWRRRQPTTGPGCGPSRPAPSQVAKDAGYAPSAPHSNACRGIGQRNLQLTRMITACQQSPCITMARRRWRPGLEVLLGAFAQEGAASGTEGHPGPTSRLGMAAHFRGPDAAAAARGCACVRMSSSTVVCVAHHGQTVQSQHVRTQRKYSGHRAYVSEPSDSSPGFSSGRYCWQT